jgi:hypothetical protein
MDGLGLLVVMAFIILIIVIFDKQSCPSGNCVREGFSSASQDPYWDSYASKPQTSMPTQPTLTMPVVGPAATNVTKKKEPTGYTGVSDLPSAPVANLGEVNSLPYQDPRFEKVSTQMLRQLKQDMDGFAANEMPELKDRSDPAVKLPLTRFQGDYQRVKDELVVVDRTPGFQSQLAVEDLNEMAANLRFLQRTYRLYSANEMVPAPEGGLSKVGVEPVEGFTSGSLSDGFAVNENSGCSITPVSLSTCLVGRNLIKIANAIFVAYGRKVAGINAGSRQEVLQRIGAPSEFTPLMSIERLSANSAEASQYISNRDLYIKSRGLDIFDRNIIKSYIDSIVYNASPLDKEAYKSLAQFSAVDYINTKYNLGVTSATISQAPEETIPNSPPAFNPQIVESSALYKKYIPTSSSSSNRTPSTRPSYPTDPAEQPISVTELNILRQKIAVEILRLQASGTTDPVLAARVNVFKKIQTAVEDIATQVQNGAMRPEEIPIRKRDYDKFLPALGDQSAGVAGLLSSTGYPSLSSLFNAYDRGDVTGPQLTQNLFQHYADSLLQGLSYKLDISYTSPNEVAARQAEATKAAADVANAAWPQPGVGNQIFAGLSGAFQTTHPMTFDGARGAFDAYTRQLDMQGFQGELELGSQGLPDGTYARQTIMPNSAAAANFDWKGRAQTICDNVKKMGLNPADFGCQTNPQGSAQNADFSWRGYAKMVCNRLKTVMDPGVPEQVGCPPDSWKGWRT